MSDQANSNGAGKDRSVAAWIACGTVFVAFSAYWLVQIQDVRELLALAYG
jgi:hypothetical protein